MTKKERLKLEQAKKLKLKNKLYKVRQQIALNRKIKLRKRIKLPKFLEREVVPITFLPGDIVKTKNKVTDLRLDDEYLRSGKTERLTGNQICQVLKRFTKDGEDYYVITPRRYNTYAKRILDVKAKDIKFFDFAKGNRVIEKIKRTKSLKMKTALGNCFKVGFEILLYDFKTVFNLPDVQKTFNGFEKTLVHGKVKGRGELKGVRFAHCWVELKKGDTELVADFSNGCRVIMTKEMYYDLGEPISIKKYNTKQAMQKALKFEHYGPWVKELEEKTT